MRTLIYSLLLCAIGYLGPVTAAASVNATVIQLDGRSSKGQITGRTEDQLQFLQGGIRLPIRIENIKGLIFDLDVDVRKLGELKAERQHEEMIAILGPALMPFEEFADLPSNLTPFNTLLMELYYTAGQYDPAVSIAAKMAQGDRDAELQEKARIYQLLSLIDSGHQDEAEALTAEYKWNKTEDDASPARLYLTAKRLAGKQQYTEALISAAKIIALNKHDSDWIQPAELLCAELYVELGRYDSAEEVIRQISLLYQNSEVADKAAQLQSRMNKLRAERL